MRRRTRTDKKKDDNVGENHNENEDLDDDHDDHDDEETLGSMYGWSSVLPLASHRCSYIY